MLLKIRQLIRRVLPSGEVRFFRILDIDFSHDVACIFDCTDPPSISSAFPELVKLPQLKKSLLSREAVLLEHEDDPFIPNSLLMPTPNQLEACERKYNDIADIIENHSIFSLVDSSVRSKAVKAAQYSYVDINGLLRRRSHRTINLTLRQWWRGGMVKFALIPNYTARGGNAPPKPESIKPGRKPKFEKENPDWQGINLTEQDRLNLRDGYQKFRINAGDRLSVAYSKTLMKYWPQLTLRSDGTVQSKLPPRGSAPSFDQWRYQGEKLLKDVDLEARNKRLRSLYGEHVFDNQMRPEMLSVSRNSDRPGGVCQYDATPFPIYLVNDDRSRVVGNAIVFTMTDTKTHFIFTPFVKIENEGYGVSQQGLYEICRRHDESDQQVRGMPLELGLPTALAVDRGPYMSLDSDRLSQMLGVRIEQGRSYFPLARSLVETTHLMIERVLNKLPGTYHWQDKGPPDGRPALASALTLDEFRQAVVMAVNYLNEWSEIEDYPFDEDMIDANLSTRQFPKIPSGMEKRGQ